MENTLENEVLAPFINGSLALNTLDLREEGELDLFNTLVEKTKGNILNQINIEDDLDKELLYYWIKSNPNNILQLPYNLYFAEIMELYFYDRMEKTLPEDENMRPMSIFRGVDGYFAFSLVYDTRFDDRNREKIRYYDAQLNMPVEIDVSQFDLTIKIYDIMKLLTVMNISLASLSYNSVKRYFYDKLYEEYRNVFMVVVDKKKVGYYSFARYYKAMSETIISHFDEMYDTQGVLITNLQIREITPMGETISEIERLYRNYRKDEQELEHVSRREQISLDAYERKASIHNMYPNFPIGMTEVEKDLALDRYLRKVHDAASSVEKLEGYVDTPEPIVSQTKSTPYSYSENAIKKSDKEEGDASTIVEDNAGEPISLPPKPIAPQIPKGYKKKPIWLMFLITAVILGGGILILFLGKNSILDKAASNLTWDLASVYPFIQWGLVVLTLFVVCIEILATYYWQKRRKEKLEEYINYEQQKEKYEIDLMEYEDLKEKMLENSPQV